MASPPISYAAVPDTCLCEVSVCFRSKVRDYSFFAHVGTSSHKEQIKTAFIYTLKGSLMRFWRKAQTPIYVPQNLKAIARTYPQIASLRHGHCSAIFWIAWRLHLGLPATAGNPVCRHTKIMLSTCELKQSYSLHSNRIWLSTLN